MRTGDRGRHVCAGAEAAHAQVPAACSTTHMGASTGGPRQSGFMPGYFYRAC